MAREIEKTLPGMSFESISSIVSEFQKRYENKETPSIQEYLQKVVVDAQPVLFRNLLNIEVNEKRKAKIEISMEEYLAKYPQFTSTVRNAFLESSLHATFSGSNTLAHEPNTEATLSTEVKEGNAPLLNLGNYQLVKELGRGAMGVVYEAIRSPDKNKVALKVLPAVSGQSLHLFKQEFRTLAYINHPNLVGLQALESDGQYWFFGMDLIKGIDFLKHVRPDGKLHEANLRSALSQLVVGVMALHSHHVMHRDLKPSNVLIDSEGHLRLLDFGLVIRVVEGQQEQEIAGTPLYMSPEQASGKRITPASDWYSVGVMIYQALCGKPPFEGTVQSVLKDKQELPAPELPNKENLPNDLVSLCMKLLSRDPKERPSALDIAKVVAKNDKGALNLGSTSSSALFGRETQIKTLEQVLGDWTKSSAPASVFISGRSGEGKTTLAEYFLENYKGKKQGVILSGRCYDRESMPFKALDSLVDHLATFLQSKPEEETRNFLPSDIRVLSKLFPVLERVKAIANSPHLSVAQFDEQQIKQRAIGALKDLLCKISEKSPVIIFIDDLQWGDRASAQVLFDVLQPSEGPKVLLVATYRSDEADKSQFLQLWNNLTQTTEQKTPHKEIKVGPLSQTESVALVVSLLKKDTEEIRNRALQFAAETGGNALLLTELVGCFDPDQDSFQTMEMSQVMRKKLERLPSEAEKLLKVVAVSGQALPLEEASKASGYENSLVATVTKMRNERLVRIVNPDSEIPLVDTYHDQVRGTVLKNLPSDSKKEIHVKLARVIETISLGSGKDYLQLMESSDAALPNEAGSHRAYDLAYHYDAGGEQTKAFTFALMAAERAKSQASPDFAAKQFSICDRNSKGSLSKRILYRFRSAYGHTLMMLGKYEDSGIQLLLAKDLSESVVQLAKVEVVRGELSDKQAKMLDAISTFERTLRRLKVWVPRHFLGYFIGLGLEMVIQAGHTLFPKRLFKRKATPEDVCKINLFVRATYPYFFRNSIKTAWVHFSGLNLCERHPPSTLLAQNYAIHGVILCLLGWTKRANQYLERSLALRKQFSDIWGEGQTLCYQGLCHYMRAKYDAGISVFEKAINLFGKAGDLWELDLSLFHKGYCHYALGDFSNAIQEARKAFETSVKIGEDARAHCSALLLVKASKGKISFAELKRCYRPVPEDVMSTTNGLLGEGYWYDFQGNTEMALTHIEKSFNYCMSNGLINYHTIETVPALAMALRKHAQHLKKEGNPGYVSYERRAYRMIKIGALVIDLMFPVHRSFALRELGIQHNQHGKLRKARRAFQQSCRIAKAYKEKYELALSQLELGNVQLALKNESAKDMISKATETIKRLESAIDSVPTNTPGKDMRKAA